jgi:outer membrane protein assembly factor BamB
MRTRRSVGRADAASARRRGARSARRTGAPALLLAAAACGGGQTQGAAFDVRWSDDDGAGIAAFHQQFAATRAPPAADVAVGVVGVAGDPAARALVGAPLAGGRRWTFTHALDARPAIAGGVVVGLGDGELFALDALTGTPLWRRGVGGKLRGAGDDGETTVVSVMPSAADRSVILAINRDGEVLRQLEDSVEIGVPGVVGRYAFLPWQGRYVTVFDLQAGNEIARVKLRTPVSRVFALGGSLFFGGAEATRFDAWIWRSATGKASTVTLPALGLPGAPAWMSPGTEVLGPEATTADKIRLYARPLPRGVPAIDDGRFASTYFRVAIGLDAGRAPQAGPARVAWVRTAEADHLGGAAYGGGVALCDARGEVALLDARSGAMTGSVSLGAPLVACVVQADRFTVAPKPNVEPVARQIERFVTRPDAELMAMRRFLLQELAGLPGDDATDALMRVAGAETTPPPLAEDARRAFEARRQGPAHPRVPDSAVMR